jgi:probable HAF family extracellular repeat protein
MPLNRVCAILCAMLLGEAAQAADTFISFDVPGATSTIAQGINADGAVVGYFVDSGGKQHGFLLSHGSFTTIDYPGAVGTQAIGINSQGDIVGSHSDDASGSASALHGFLLQQGTFTTLTYPGRLGLIAQRINDAGQIVGCNHDNDMGASMHGFLYSNGNWSELSTGMSMNTGLLPDASLILGYYNDPTNPSRLRAYFLSGGNPIPYDFPFSISTNANDMNAAGEIVGAYRDGANNVHGYLMILSAFDSTFGFTPVAGEPVSYRFISIDYPGATTTAAIGINASGHMVGRYIDAAGKQHGFLLVRGRQRRDWSDIVMPQNAVVARP